MTWKLIVILGGGVYCPLDTALFAVLTVSRSVLHMHVDILLRGGLDEGSGMTVVLLASGRVLCTPTRCAGRAVVGLSSLPLSILETSSVLAVISLNHPLPGSGRIVYPSTRFRQKLSCPSARRSSVWSGWICSTRQKNCALFLPLRSFGRLVFEEFGFPCSGDGLLGKARREAATRLDSPCFHRMALIRVCYVGLIA